MSSFQKPKLAKTVSWTTVRNPNSESMKTEFKPIRLTAGEETAPSTNYLNQSEVANFSMLNLHPNHTRN